MPAGGIADPGRAVAVMHRAEHRAEAGQAVRAFALQANPLTGADEAEGVLPAQLQAGDLQAIRWRGQSGDQDLGISGPGFWWLIRNRPPLRSDQ